MADWYYDPAGGNNANSGDSWAVAASGADGVTNGTTTFTTVTGGLTGRTGRFIRIAGWLRKIVSVESDTNCTLDATCSSGSGRPWAIGGAVQAYSYLGYSDYFEDGDVIKYPKTGGWEAAGTITYTSQNAEVVIAAGRVAIIDQCESAWAGTTNMTVTLDTGSTYHRFGSGSLKMVVGSSFTTGKMAFFDLGAGNELDLSSFAGVSMLAKVSSSLAANSLVMCLCSDAAGDTVVDTIPLMGGSSALYNTQWHVFKGTRTGGGALGSSIRSIAFYAAADPGTPTIYIDNIVAVKAETGDADHICHNCLIGQGNTIDDMMWAVEGFTDATHVKLIDEWYGGTPGAVTSYRVEPGQMWGTYFTLASASSSRNFKTGMEVVNSGGWNTSTDTQDGVTCWRLLPSSSSNYYAVSSPSNPYYAVEHFIFPAKFELDKYDDGIRIEKCGFTGSVDWSNCGLKIYYSSFTTNGFQASCVLRDLWFSAMYTQALYLHNHQLVGGYGDMLIDWVWENITAYSTEGFFTGDLRRFRARNIKLSNCRAGGYQCWYLYERTMDMDIVGLELKDNTHGTYAAFCSTDCLGRVRIWNLVASGNTKTFAVGNLDVICYNPDIDDGTINTDLYQQGRLALLKRDGDADDHIIYDARGTIQSETSVRHTASGVAWKFSPTDAYDRAILHRLGEIAVEAGVEVTIGVYMRRDNTGINGRLRIPGGWLAGMDTDDYVDEIEANANIWELVSVTFTPTETGVVEPWVEAWGGTTYNLYVDDLSVTV